MRDLGKFGRSLTILPNAALSKPADCADACISILEGALSGVHEAARILQSVAANSDALLQASAEDEAVGCPPVSCGRASESAGENLRRPVTDLSLTRELEVVEQLLNTTVETCLELRRIIQPNEGTLRIENITDKARDGAPL